MEGISTGESGTILLKVAKAEYTKSSNRGDVKLDAGTPKILIKSGTAKSLAVRRVNSGKSRKKTAGGDGVKSRPQSSVVPG
jgi:hypothetical protein